MNLLTHIKNGIGGFRLRSPLLVRVCVAVCVTLFMMPVMAAPNVRLVVSENSGVYERIAESIRAQLVATDRPINIETRSAADMANATSAADLTVTIGTKAAASISRPKVDGDVISVLISRSASIHLQKSRPVLRSQSISVVTLEQNITRFFALAEKLLPDAKNIGVVLGPVSGRRENAIRAAAASRNINLRVVKLDTTQNPIAQIEPALVDSELFMVMPDSQRFNRSVAKWILQLGYRHRVPVIAYSARFADAGALGAIYSSPDDIALQAAQMIERYLENGELQTGTRSPQIFSVALNKAVAKAMGIPLSRAEAWRQELQAAKAPASGKRAGIPAPSRVGGASAND